MFTGIAVIALWTLLVPSHPLEEKASQRNPLAGDPRCLERRNESVPVVLFSLSWHNSQGGHSGPGFDPA